MTMFEESLYHGGGIRYCPFSSCYRSHRAHRVIFETLERYMRVRVHCISEYMESYAILGELDCCKSISQ